MAGESDHSILDSNTRYVVMLMIRKLKSCGSIIGALKHFENSVDMMRMSMVSPSYCEQVGWIFLKICFKI